MIAIPEVNPVITGAGIKEVSVPNRKSPAASKNRPAKKVASNTPCIPFVAAIDIKIAAIAPVGPDI